MEILQAFGLDIKLLIANLVNFVLLVAILYKLGYKPILKFVKERQDKIEKGLTDAEHAAKKLSDATSEKEKMLSKSHKEAQEIIGKARDQAQVQADALIKKTKDETKTIVERAKKEIKLEREHAVAAAKKETAQVVMVVSEKLLKKNIDSIENKTFVQESINAIK